MGRLKIAFLLLTSCTAGRPPDASVDALPPYVDTPCDMVHCTTIACPPDGGPCTCYWPPADPIRCNAPQDDNQ